MISPEKELELLRRAVVEMSHQANESHREALYVLHNNGVLPAGARYNPYAKQVTSRPKVGQYLSD